MNTLYDIHYHAFDLSHANIIAFLKRDDLVTTTTIKKLLHKLPFLTNVIPVWLIRFFPAKIADKLKVLIADYGDRVENLLGVIENAIEYHFLYTEYFLKHKEPVFPSPDNELKFEKIALCPLMIDFGYKNLKGNTFYNAPPKKPVINQMVDLFNAIYYYYNYNIIKHPDENKSQRLKVIPNEEGRKNKLFEFYPFMGINTKNYTLNELEAMFEKYFRGYEKDGLRPKAQGANTTKPYTLNPKPYTHNPPSRAEKIRNKIGTIEFSLDDIDNSTIDFTYLFAGIKLYPPLGFDPWPEDSIEREKVEFLYSSCIHKNIPITVHCSDGGFEVDKNAKLYTNPAAKWSEVLSQERFKELKINFAHMGKQKSTRPRKPNTRNLTPDTRNQKPDPNNWQSTIFKYLEEYPNAYTDFSCCAFNSEFYQSLAPKINTHNASKILFGSDFLINLLFTDSYNGYVDEFIKTTHLSKEAKQMIGGSNCVGFLFGG